MVLTFLFRLSFHSLVFFCLVSVATSYLWVICVFFSFFFFFHMNLVDWNSERNERADWMIFFLSINKIAFLLVSIMLKSKRKIEFEAQQRFRLWKCGNDDADFFFDSLFLVFLFFLFVKLMGGDEWKTSKWHHWPDWNDLVCRASPPPPLCFILSSPMVSCFFEMRTWWSCSSLDVVWVGDKTATLRKSSRERRVKANATQETSSQRSTGEFRGEIDRPMMSVGLS